MFPKDNPTAVVDGCVTTGKTVDVATYEAYPNQQWGIAVRYHGDSLFHHLSGVNTGRLVRGTDIFAYLDYEGNQYTKLTTTSNLAAALKPGARNGMGIVTYYEFIPSQTTVRLPYSTGGTYHKAYSFAISSNGRYISAYIDYLGYVLIDLVTNQARKLLPMKSYAYNDDASKPTVGVISDDGRYVFVTAGPSGMIIDTVNCGDNLTDTESTPWVTVPCRITDFGSQIRQVLGYPAAVTYPFFTDDGLGVEYEASFYPGTQSFEGLALPKHVTIHPAGFVASHHLDYLAMGDSYSSGEGDLGKDENGVNYYTPVTDFEGGCHLSTRSYPFLLRYYWGIQSDKMQSVACSGAKVVSDYNSSMDSYMGQRGQLASLDDAAREKMRQRALDVYIPGYDPQLEFVKKYRPKVITLTGGGNDVGFVDILSDCASNVNICGFVGDKSMHDLLWDAIHSQYSHNKSLVDDIKSESPASKVYIIGYPSFIAGSWNTCLNSGMLIGSERDMINDAVAELNKVQRQVATDTGATYVDIEKSLEGGRLCEGSEYMTGVIGKGIINVLKGDKNELFHPNAAGHQKIATAIETAIGPDPANGVSGGAQSNNVYIQSDSQTIPAIIVPNGTAQSGSSLSVKQPAYTFASSSSVTATIHSDPVTLGTFTTNSDGSLTQTITLPPSIEPGYHVLVLTGKSMSGEPLTLYQFITVTSSLPGDEDGDGIPNAQDPCQFIEHWYNEDEKDVCLPIVVVLPGSPVVTTDSSKPAPNEELTESDVIGASSENNVTATPSRGAGLEEPTLKHNDDTKPGDVDGKQQPIQTFAHAVELIKDDIETRGVNGWLIIGVGITTIGVAGYITRRYYGKKDSKTR